MRSIKSISNLAFRLKKIVKDGLNKPGFRPLLGLIASLYSISITHKLSKIYYDEGVWVHKYRDGVIVDRRINYRPTIGGYISNAKDNWEFMYKLKPGDVVVDIGAGVGSDTFYFSKAVGSNGKVISIEAHPQTYRCLQKFCQFNALDNVFPENIAVSDIESEVIISDDEKHISSTILGANEGRFRVKSLPLDFLVEKLNIKSIDFLKMNIEGAEKLAIRGMLNCIKRTNYVCISCHDFKADREGLDEMRSKNIVQAFLTNNGFEIMSRATDKRAWVRDYIYGRNKNFSP